MSLSGTEITRLGPGILGARPARIFTVLSTIDVEISLGASATIGLLGVGGIISESVTIAGKSGVGSIVLVDEDHIADGDIELEAFQSQFYLD